MELIKLINLENVSDEEANEFSTREAARAIVFDKENKIALLHATKYNYFKLPGGGINKGETKEEALKRECIEEIGCNVKIINEVGFTIEYRKQFNTKQTSYCYIAKLVGEKGEPKLEPDELEEGFKTIWLAVDDAQKKLMHDKSDIYEIPYMVKRDSALLDAAKKLI